MASFLLSFFTVLSGKSRSSSLLIRHPGGVNLIYNAFLSLAVSMISLVHQPGSNYPVITNSWMKEHKAACRLAAFEKSTVAEHRTDTTLTGKRQPHVPGECCCSSLKSYSSGSHQIMPCMSLFIITSGMIWGELIHCYGMSIVICMGVW